ncbi:MAG: hypothetical protein WCK02_01575 [Bacteroidota bacterium]
MRGFESFTRFKNGIKDSKHILDITLHLYKFEMEVLGSKLEELNDKPDSFKTSTNLIEHNTRALYSRLQNRYPDKLKQLLLINLITSLEVYLTDVILEIFQRDIRPFKLDEAISLQRNYILSLGSIDTLKEAIVKKDFRNLTSGGLVQIVKYYQKIFQIDIKSLGIDFGEIEEIHIRRHLYVHRNGLADEEYCRKFPSSNTKVDKYIYSDNQYIFNAIDKILNFGNLVNKQLLNKFPIIERNVKYKKGERNLLPNELFIMLEISIRLDGFDVFSYLEQIEKNGKKLKDFIVKFAQSDNICYLFLNGSQSDINAFYKVIMENENILLNKSNWVSP